MVAEATRIVVGVHLQDDTDGLRRSLPTAVHQQLPVPLDVVVVDDAAGAAARRALAELVGWYPNVTVVRNAARQGRAAARNRILDEADDAAIAWLDVGDVWHPRKLAVQHDRLLAAGAGPATLIACSHRIIDLRAASEDVVTPDVTGDLIARLVAHDLAVPVGTLFGTAGAHRLAGGFDAALPYRDDEEFLLRFLHAGGRIAVAEGGPLSTGSVVRDHPTAQDVAIAERRIRRVHGRAVRSADRSAARRAHRRELQRAARLHRKDDRVVRSTLYRVRADVTAVVDRFARSTAGGRDASPGVPIEDRRHEALPSDPPNGTPRGPDPEPGPEYAEVLRSAERGDWAAALDAWDRLPPGVRSGADPTTYEVVARSQRALGRFSTAIGTAERGLEVWPRHPRIEMELAKSRAATTDWSAAMAPAGALADPGTAPGVVTSLGLLAGGEGYVTGHVTTARPTVPVEVSLHVDDLTIVSTQARAPDRADPAARRPFSLSCEQLLEFLGDGDRISVSADGETLQIEGFGAAAEVRTGYPSRLPALRARLDDGAIFTKFGRLRPGYTPARKRRTLELVDEVSEVVHAAYGYGCTPFYGNLLGAVREQDFIAHDVGGFDIGYLSREHAPAAVRAEFSDLCRRLLDRGYHLELEPFGAMIRRGPGDRIFVDLNYAWLTEDGQLRMSYGWRHEPVTGHRRLEAPRDTYLAGRLVPIPADAEGVLHQVYGPGWITPDQGFDLGLRLQRDEEFLLSDAERQALHGSAPERVVVLPARD